MSGMSCFEHTSNLDVYLAIPVAGRSRPYPSNSTRIRFEAARANVIPYG